jgi:molybdenum cofactor cytidylyltransferase
MGTQKLLLPFAGKTVIGHIVDQLIQGKVDRVCVVIGADAEAVGKALSGRELALVRNPELDAEMLSSARCGIAALPAECEAALIVLGDQPAISPALVDRLIEEFRDHKGGIIVPVHVGHRGHPMLISMKYRDEIMTGHDHSGLRGLLDAHQEDVLKLPADESVLQDMDFPEDYKRALSQISDGPPLP